MADPSKAFFDTNVFVYAFDRAEPVKRQRAAALLERHAEAGTLVLSTQVLQEFYWITTRKLARPLASAVARREVERLASLRPLRVDSPLVLSAIDRSEESGIAFWDALIVEAALRSRCEILYTEDLQDGWEVDGRLRVVNPFA